MKSIAIIPARGGSKRLPRKNILPLNNRPLLYYPVQAALKSGLFERVIVSTEDDEIKQAAVDSGAQVADRPADLAGDGATVAQVCGQLLESCETPRPQWFCCIYPTAVFIGPEDLKKSFRLKEEVPSPDVIMGVSRYNLNPFQALVQKDGYLTPVWSDRCLQQSQMHPETLASNGTFYWGRVSAFLNAQTFYPVGLKGYEVPWIRAVDINTAEDYGLVRELARAFFEPDRRA